MTLKPGSLKEFADISAWIYASDARIDAQREHNESIAKMVETYQRTVQDKIDALHAKIDATNQAVGISNKQLDALSKMIYRAVGAAWVGGLLIGVSTTVIAAYITKG